MWPWFIGGFAALVLVLIGAAAFVALWCPDPKRRQDAYRVLKLILATATSTGGAAALALRLHEFGLL